MPEPQLRDRDVMVAVHAAGVNLLDPKIHDGDFKLVLKYSFPLILGNDVAGVVTQVEKITTWLTAELNLLPRSRIL